MTFNGLPLTEALYYAGVFTFSMAIIRFLYRDGFDWSAWWGAMTLLIMLFVIRIL